MLTASEFIRPGRLCPTGRAALPSFPARSASTSGLFRKILIANRGEIACRVMKTAKRMGIKTVAVFSEADRNAKHVAMADEAYLLGPPPAAQSYLLGDRILDVARRTGAAAIHPGYGFLSENAKFSQQCADADVVFIGPPASAITAMGSKSESKLIMEKAGVQCVPGYHGEDQSFDTLKREAERIGYPVLVKAVMGGGGKGMRIVHKPSDLEEALASSKNEARNSFADDRVLIEKYIINPRHIEYQVFGDHYGNYVYLFERDCSVQRRHQKIIEEAPAPHFTPEQRTEMGKAACDAAAAVGYYNAGTVEFISDPRGFFYFMEMNTRLQVEHPISEMITGEDFVEWQLKVAAGQRLPKLQDDLRINGHAFECRIYAENPDRDFMPGTGRLVHMRQPEELEGVVRIDTGVRQGDEVSVYYDPMIAKLITWGGDREQALRRMNLALGDYNIVGLHTNIEFLKRLATNPAFIEGHVDTGFIKKHQEDLLPPWTPAPKEVVALAALTSLFRSHKQAATAPGTNDVSVWHGLTAFRPNYSLEETVKIFDEDHPVSVSVKYHADHAYTMTINGEAVHLSGSMDSAGVLTAVVDNILFKASTVEHDDHIYLFCQGKSYTFKLDVATFDMQQSGKGSLLSPMPGKITKVFVEDGQAVEADQPLLVLEAMKMEHTIRAPMAGKIANLSLSVGDLVEEKRVLVNIEVEGS